MKVVTSINPYGEGNPMFQTGLFDCQKRFEQLTQAGDPLVKLNQVINWELFRPELERIRDKERKSNAGRPPYDAVLMFKILVLQSLYNIADDQTEFQIRDRLSFMRFLGLTVSTNVPDAKTIWLFREQLAQDNMVKLLFEKFDRFLNESGFAAKKGQIIDASIIQTPRQRNSREQNKQIKNGEVPQDWSENKRRQKDTDARWTKKNGKTFFGYKNHISADVKHKLIRDYDITDAAVHDSQVFEQILDVDNTSRDVYADSAYRSREKLDALDERGFREHIQRKGCRNKKLSKNQQRGNRTRSKIRSRIEHIFGVQAQRAGRLLVRTIGIVRAKTKIGLRNLAYNIDRYGTLVVT
jgi:IS5 family transposase